MLPSVANAIGDDGKIAIFTASGDSLTPMHETVKRECGVDWNEERRIIVGCQDVPGFEAVAHGDPVDLAKVTPGIVAKAKQVMMEHPDIHAFLFECTQLPPFSDDVRAATGLPVFDAIGCCDFFMQSFVDNPQFGLNSWHKSWDGNQEPYELGDCLSPQSKMRLSHSRKEGC